MIVNPGFGKSYADFGIFSFAGRGGGFNIGTDAFIGFLRGQNIEGHAVNLNFVAGPVQVSVVLGEEGKGFQGIIIGLGPAVPAGFSATESITESFTVKKLLNKLFNDKDKKNDYKK